jgi:hypothetical protein
MLPACITPIAEYNATINSAAAADQQQILFVFAVIGSA